MKIFWKFPTVNISKLNFWFVICIAKNFIWTTLKVIFSIFRFFFAPSDSRFSNSCISAKYCPIITNLMERLFIQIMYKSQFKIDPYDWFCAPGSCIWITWQFCHFQHISNHVLCNIVWWKLHNFFLELYHGILMLWIQFDVGKMCLIK